MNPKPVEACLIVTYRCNAKCAMCNTWRHPTSNNQEFKPVLIDKLPNNLRFINITGGEPFLRSDLEQIIHKATSKAKRVVISTNGYFTDRIIQVANRFGNLIGVRVSIEGLPFANDELRGIKNGFEHGIRTLIKLKAMGIKDIGFGITVSDRNAKDMIALYHLADSMGIEFATAATHNSFYFHKDDNQFNDRIMIASEFEKVAVLMLQSNRPKNWFRAYFNMGLANKVQNGHRPLPCPCGSDVFFLDPLGNMLTCNGSEKPMIMGNLHNHSFKTIWHSPKAAHTRNLVSDCTRQCWMIGSVAPSMKKKITTPTKWVVKNKLKLLFNRNKSVPLDPIVRHASQSDN